MSKQSIISLIKKTLEEVHFGLSPDCDLYVNRIYVYRKDNRKLLTFNNSTDLIRSIIANKISSEDIDMDTVSVIFSDVLFEEVEQEYKKYAVK